MVARQTLTLFVRVQILLPQPKKKPLLSNKAKEVFLVKNCQNKAGLNPVKK